MTDIAEVLRQLDAAWQDLVAAVDAIPEEEMEEPGVTDAWSVKDLLGHIAFWAHKGAHDVEAATRGQLSEIQPPDGMPTVDAWNERESKSRKSQPLAAVRQEWMDSFQAAKKAISASSPEALDTEVAGWSVLRRFAGDTYVHYQEHAEQIRTWSRQLETTEA